MPEGPGRCVYCRERPIALEFRPFCSARCKLLDLGRWVDGGYRIPGERVPPPASDSSEQDE